MVKLLGKKRLFDDPSIYSGDTGFVELWDFSRANTSQESRVSAVSAVASVCYGRNSLDPNFKLFDKLARESIGLPSSSFEFVPVLIHINTIQELLDFQNMVCINECEKPMFIGISVDRGHFLTNLRSLMETLERFKREAEYVYGEKWKEIYLVSQASLEPTTLGELLSPMNIRYYNTTEEEVELIKKNFFVFRKKITIRDARQLMRHRTASYQELSRRYTTSKKVPYTFRYINSVLDVVPELPDLDEQRVKLVEDKLLSNRIKAEEARDILPVNLYTHIWSGWTKPALEHFIKLRTAKSAQREIRMLAEEMKKLSELYQEGGIR